MSQSKDSFLFGAMDFMHISHLKVDTKLSQQWPDGLCKAILSGFTEELEMMRYTNAVFYNEGIVEAGEEEAVTMGTLGTIQDDFLQTEIFYQNVFLQKKCNDKNR